VGGWIISPNCNCSILMLRGLRLLPGCLPGELYQKTAGIRAYCADVKANLMTNVLHIEKNRNRNWTFNRRRIQRFFGIIRPGIILQ